VTRLETEVMPVGRLGAAERARWEEIRAANPALASPFLTHDYAAIVAAVRPGARVAVLRRPEGEIAGFLAYEAKPGGRARPIGGRLSDYHGVVIGRSEQWDMKQVLRACGIRVFRFNHVVASQREISRYAGATDSSPVVRYADHPKWSGDSGRKLRRLENAGRLEFAFHDDDAAVLRTLLNWKSAQLRRTGHVEPWSVPWVASVAGRVHAAQTPALSGVLSTLRLDGELLAAQLNLRSGRVLHVWLLAYVPSAAHYSPGTVLYRLVLDAAREHGVAEVDLGKGDEAYKQRFATASIPVVEGSVHAGSVEQIASRAWRASAALLYRSPLREYVQRLHRRLELR
jgi:CelD/BcsL family acetyltransferase involved in cellulose biosynthesis